MRKKVNFAVVLLWISLVMMLLDGCASKKETEIDIDQLADRLAGEITYEDQITLSTKEMAQLLYHWQEEEVQACKLYISAGATTEEIALFECQDATSAETVRQAAEKRIEQQKESVKTYNPKELKRLEQAVLRVEGRYVLVVISSDPEAAGKIIDEAMES